MNPSIHDEDLAEDYRKDPESAQREYGALWVNPEGAFLASAWIDRAVIEGRGAVPPDPFVRYVAGVDPSGGGADEFVVAIVHLDADYRIVVDYLQAWKGSRVETVELTAVVREIRDVLRRYNVGTVRGDHYAGKWVEQEFARNGIAYEASQYDKAKCYQAITPFFSEGRIELPDDPILRQQFGSLEKRLRPGGRIPIVDHPKGGHDDRANAVAVAAAEFAGSLAPAVDVTPEPVAAKPSVFDSTARAEVTGGHRHGRLWALDGGGLRRRLGFHRSVA